MRWRVNWTTDKSLRARRTHMRILTGVNEALIWMWALSPMMSGMI